VKESIHLPKKTREAPASSNSEKKKPDVDDLMSQLKGMPGMENARNGELVENSRECQEWRTH